MTTTSSAHATATRTPSGPSVTETLSRRNAWLVGGLVAAATVAIVGIGFGAYEASQDQPTPASQPAEVGTYDSGTTLQRSADDVAHGSGSVVVSGSGQQVR
jgi:hypothetical protein